MPPPVAPNPLLQDVSAASIDAMLVPPTAVTSGWLAGSQIDNDVSLESGGAKQPSDPESPVAASTVWPCAAICWKSGRSNAASPATPDSASHSPQLSLTTCAVSSTAICRNSS